LGITLLATWTLGMAMFRESATVTAAYIWAWVQNASGSYVVIPLFFLSLYFPYQHYVLKSWHKWLIIISTAVITLVVSIPGVWIKEMIMIPSANDYTLNFWGVAYFNLHFYFYTFLSFYNFIKKFQVSGGFMRVQLTYTIWAIGIVALFGVFLPS
jgi:hypothetical protein